MKKILFMFIALAVAGFLGEYKLLADEPDFSNKPDSMLTKDQAKIRISEFLLKVKSDTADLDKINASVDNLKKDLDDTKAKYQNCNEQLYKMIGASPDDVEKFRQRIGVLEGKIREKQRLSGDALVAQKEQIDTLLLQLKEITKNKICLLPDVYEKVISLARDIKGLYAQIESTKAQKKTKTYTVGTWEKDRDCLWNIAGKLDIYGDPFMWPKLWLANPDLIRNPDIIHPGQVLKINPAGPSTSEETKKVQQYWRHKRTIQQQKEQEEPSKRGE
jgi:hypothetical protein